MGASFSHPNRGAFEAYAGRYLSDLWRIELHTRSVTVGGAVSKQFDLVSKNARYVGAVKWYTKLDKATGYWSAIAECVWLLQKLDAAKVFMVFGAQADIPALFLERFRPLVGPVEFYFLDDSGHHLL